MNSLNFLISVLALMMIFSLGWTVSHDWSEVKNVNVTSQQISSELQEYLVPVGAVMSFAGSCPEGWLFANGSEVSSEHQELRLFLTSNMQTNNTPDLRGIFVRGAGTNSILKDANGSSFEASVGKYQNDSFQVHKHYIETSNGADEMLVSSYATGEAGGGNSAGWGAVATRSRVRTTEPENMTDLESPRTTYETRPANFALVYCIKY